MMKDEPPILAHEMNTPNFAQNSTSLYHYHLQNAPSVPQSADGGCGAHSESIRK